MAGRAHLLSPAGFRQRQHCVDEYLALAGIDELRDLGKRRRTGRVRVKDGPDAVPFRLIPCRKAKEDAADAARFKLIPGSVIPSIVCTNRLQRLESGVVDTRTLIT